jgi:hypothetical protein
MLRSTVRWATLAALATVLSLGPAGCQARHDLAMVPMDELPSELSMAPRVVVEAYSFAAANPDVLREIPCYCGCGTIGHASNYACYVKSTDTDGRIEYDLHAVNCSLCIDITQDTMRMLERGESVSSIRQFIDETYARYGPSNMP